MRETFALGLDFRSFVNANYKESTWKEILSQAKEMLVLCTMITRMGVLTEV